LLIEATTPTDGFNCLQGCPQYTVLSAVNTRIERIEEGREEEKK
jgi:hypothetical protein